ncbi:MAG: hypothetical protein U1F35_17680 [Steroidobacteraceae bacterium]
MATTSAVTTGWRAPASVSVPQEITTEAFETVWAAVNFSRGLFGKAPAPGYLEKVLRDLSLWSKKDSPSTRSPRA